MKIKNHKTFLFDPALVEPLLNLEALESTKLIFRIDLLFIGSINVI